MGVQPLDTVIYKRTGRTHRHSGHMPSSLQRGFCLGNASKCLTTCVLFWLALIVNLTVLRSCQLPPMVDIWWNKPFPLLGCFWSVFCYINRVEQTCPVPFLLLWQHPNQKQPSEERIYSVYNSPATIHHWEKSGQELTHNRRSKAETMERPCYLAHD